MNESKIISSLAAVVFLIFFITAGIHKFNQLGNSIVAVPMGMYPSKNITPGALNPAVTQATINKTICVPNWTATIRPPVTYTNKLKKQQLATSYFATTTMVLSDFEEDHLISLQLGGSPTSALNLWPESYDSPGAREKDQVENYLKRQVCNGSMTLKDAQTAIVKDWYAIYTKIASKLGAVEDNIDPDDN